MNFIERNKEIYDVKMLSPLVWAYVGDSVYEMFIRTNLVNHSNAKPHKLHIESIKYVKAKAQGNILDKIYDSLTDEEKEIVRRGRNTENHHTAKNSNVAEYAKATSFEALIGYLYLIKEDERLKQILELCID
jgi:ribonuclease-3 family protein